MRIRWRNLELPTKVVADPATRTDTYAKFVAEPFERGFGVTVGNGLRRVLLSSIEGTAVTSVKIQGVKHEFSSLDGMKEDVTDVVLALKRLRIRFHSDEPKVLTIEKRGPGQVTGADVKCGSDCEVVNKDLVIATLTTDRAFEAEIEVKKGRGYVTQEENAREEHEIGQIPLDAIFSPVQRVRYRTENTRVGKMTNYDRLVIELWTDGTVTPEMALVEAGKIYRKHLNPFIHFFDVGKELGTPGASPSAPAAAVAAGGPAAGGEGSDDLRRKLALPVSSLDLSVRAGNALEAEGIQTVGELVGRTEEQLLKLKNFGRTSIKEVEKKLQAMELSFGMDVASVLGSK
ncbi:MAG: DNA-directed RNA polymerase subunit alpha [Planctomycetia bacterium]|nr:DNA-directed RNA polymerase subunit alpha [Planctomycetia bacterium]